ncbi:methyltransferase [Cohnella boryungensis]|uniref:Methyltransferase n=1 Tax=Cohnella boryungensis TaxID=768479 RepID=A0ABV8S8Q5_9BACL
MDKILVEIYIPVVDRSFDVYIPVSLKLYEVEALLSGAFKELCDGQFVASPDTVLCDKLTGMVLDINQSVLELGLMNGSRLMLI